MEGFFAQEAMEAEQAAFEEKMRQREATEVERMGEIEEL